MSFFDRCHPKNLQTHDFSGVLGTRPFCNQSVAKMTHSTMHSDLLSGNRTLIILINLIKLFFWVLSKKSRKTAVFDPKMSIFSKFRKKLYIVLYNLRKLLKSSFKKLLKSRRKNLNSCDGYPLGGVSKKNGFWRLLGKNAKKNINFPKVDF